MLNKLKPKSEFTKNVLTLMTGTTIAQAIPIAISPILTRLYTPEDFGVFALFTAIVSIFGSIANGRYELAIMLPKKDEDAINIFALGFIINVGLALFLLIIILFFHDYIVKLLNNKEISPWLYFVPFSVFLIGCFNLLNYFNNRLKQYKDLAKANVYKSIGMAIVQLSLGFLKTGALGLISGQIVSQIISNTKLFFNIKKLNLFRYIRKAKIFILSKQYKKHPIYLLPTTLMDTFSLKIPLIGINYFLGIGIAGQYALVERLLSLPSGLIGGSVGQVFYREFSLLIQQNQYNEAKRLLVNTWKKLFKLGFIPFLLILLFSQHLFSLIFGNNWIYAGKIAQILVVMYFIMFISSPVSSAYNVLNMQKLNLIFGIVALIYRLIIFLIIIQINLYLALYLYVIVEVLQIILYNFFILRRLRWYI